MRQFRYFSPIYSVLVALAIVIITVKRALALLGMTNQSKSISYVICSEALTNIRIWLHCFYLRERKERQSSSNARVHLARGLKMDYNININKICRVCLEEGVLTSVFNTEFAMMPAEMMMLCAKVKVFSAFT